MRYIRYIFLLVLFIGIVLFLHKDDDKLNKEEEKKLHNGVEFSGEVVSIRTSNNHSFGIIFLKLKKANLSNFSKANPTEEYPYRISGVDAELYTSIPDGISPGDIVSVNSNKATVTYYYKKQKERHEGFLSIIADPYNIKFIGENKK